MIAFSKEFTSRCQKEDQKAQKELFEKLYAPMYRVCFRYIGRQAEAEDCLMKAFMKIFQKLETFEWQNEHSLFFWIRKIMVNEALMELRRNNLLLVVQSENLPEEVEDSNTIDQLSAEELFGLITKLPDGYRTVFNLYVVEGYSHQEIARMLSISESTSKSQLLKARGRLKLMVEKMNNVYGSYAG
ncbi:sigma-70 family RNA polymerase sigma factor [Adhaeribacter sp. BT258]|uniref:Sigma-70 family RNA polymerase sigma factor n=1 Tax=Adhaeribacter terrigena TaxID=2793070 RepID=A0ABS1C614_9BACT|nr:sigma-70 family RNA polymerase sigma factor [Adhaeribacter terrigena]MBK0404815.1 sigma-70 family RNA polymerase sigma factor [Adhaeribacter terrigena]